jgi:hypothetical protein
MATRDREDQDLIDELDSALLRAIRGAFWFPLVYVPRQIQRSFPSVARLLRICLLLAAWGVFVFGPAALLDEVRAPLVGVAILAWTFLALVGSVVGVIRLRKSDRAMPGADKPEDLSEAFV